MEHVSKVNDTTNANYNSLRLVLNKAFDRASAGKGKDRHATGNKFSDQPIVTECFALNGTAGNIYQIRKKALESMRLPDEQAINELLDVIVYASACVVYLVKKNENEAEVTF